MPRTTKPTGDGKRHPLNMRTTKETREKLESAAAANGRSLAQEVEARLEASFAEERGFGGPEMRQLAYLMTSAFQVASQRDATDKNWVTNPYSYGAGVAGVLDALLIGFPNGEEKARVIEYVIGRLLTRLEHEKEQDK